MQTLVQPVRLQRVTIQPISLLVSIHASLKLYIASDHTPLSFSLFERGPVCTTARQLVHALAMHYAAGALFRAGTCCTQPFTHISFHSPKPHFHFKLACVSRIDARAVLFSLLNFSIILISLFITLFLTSICITEGEIYSHGGSHLYAIRQECFAQVRNLFLLSPVLRLEMITPLGCCCRFVPQRDVKSCSCEQQNFQTQSGCFV